MEFFTLYIFMSIEKIAAFLMLGGSMFGFGLGVFILSYVIPLFLTESKTKEGVTTNNFSELLVKFKKMRKWGVILLIVGSVFYTISSLLPTKKELAVIVGGGLTYQMLTSEAATKMGSSAVQLLQKQIDEALEGDITKVIPKDVVDKGVEMGKNVATETYKNAIKESN